MLRNLPEIENSYFKGVFALLFFAVINILFFYKQIDFPTGVLYVPVLLYIHFNMQGNKIPGLIMKTFIFIFISFSVFYMYAYYIAVNKLMMDIYRLAYILTIIIMYLGVYGYVMLNIKKWNDHIDPYKCRIIIMHCNMILIIAVLLFLLSYHRFTSPGTDIFSLLTFYAIYTMILLNLFLTIYTIITSFGKKENFNNPPEEDVKEKKFALPVETLKQYEEKLKYLMEIKELYRQNNLSIKLLVEESGIPGHHLSELFSSYLNKKFYPYIAEYRIAYAVKYLENYKDNLTIEGLAYECGFKSKTTFNKYFKEIVGCSLSEYKYNLRVKPVYR